MGLWEREDREEWFPRHHREQRSRSRHRRMVIKLEIDGAGHDIPHDLKGRLEEKIGGLDEYMDSLDGGNVTVAWEGGHNERTSVRAQVWGPGHRFEASDTDWNATTSVDKAHHKLETQIRRDHGKGISERWIEAKGPRG